MSDLGANRSVWRRLAEVAGRLALCLAFALPPLANVAAGHGASGPAAATAHHHDGHADGHAPRDAGDKAHSCHYLGACHAFMAAPEIVLPLDRVPPVLSIAAADVPPSVVAHRLLRPPRTAFRA